MVSRDDEAGASVFTWTQAGELASATDALTGQRRDFDWDDAGQLEQMRSAGGALRQWFYDGMGRVRREVLRGPGGQDADFEYGYDADGSPVRQEVTLDGDAGAAANPAEGMHRYCYDDAGRLARWDRRQPAEADAPADCAPVDPAAPDAGQVTDYRWDAAGNRVAAGGERFGYDQRNRLTSGPAGAYSYTARGTLAAVTRDGAATVSVFDALGRQVQAGPVSLAYDGLDRLVTRRSAAGETGFDYAGAEIDPVASTGELPAAYARSPGGRLLAQAEGGGPALLAGLGRHGDLTLLHTADGALAGSAVYDPFGEPAGTAGATSRLGFQADWTDPDSSQVWMGARWYDPAAAQFTSRDTVMGELTTPVALNRYTYASNSPLAYFDPDGREPCATPPNCDYGYTGEDQGHNHHTTHTGFTDPFTGANADTAKMRPAPGSRPPGPQTKAMKHFKNFTTGVLKGAGSFAWGLVYELPKGLWQTAQAEVEEALRIQREQGFAAAFLHVHQRSREMPVELALATLTGLVDIAVKAASLNPVTLYREGRQAAEEGRFDEWLEQTGRDIGELGAEAGLTLATLGAGKVASAASRALSGERLIMRSLGRARPAQPPPAVVAPNTAGSLSGSALANAGRGAEDLVSAAIGLPRNTGVGRVTVPGSGAGGYRVPDFSPFGRTGTIATRGTVVEVKEVASLSSSPQLRDLVGFAQGQGVPLEIFTNATLPRSGQLYNWIQSGQVIISRL